MARTLARLSTLKKAWVAKMRAPNHGAFLEMMMPDQVGNKFPDDAIHLTVDDYEGFVLNGQRDDRSILTIGKSGFLVSGPYRACKAGLYTVAVLGEVENGGAGAVVDVVCNSGLHEFVRTDITVQAGPGLITIFSLHIPQDVSDLEIRLTVAGDTRLKFQGVRIQERDVDRDYALLNKSYANDAHWTVILFGSYLSYVKPEVPFYLVIPRQDEELFDRLFASASATGFVERLPIILYEDWVLERTGNVPPTHFDGWHVQQVVKLAFSKLGLSRHYLTCDSAQFFTQPFDFGTALFRNGILCTTARPQVREEINQYFIDTGEICWLKGNLVPAGVAFDAIDEHFSANLEPLKYHYIGCNGIFDSDICLALEARAAAFGYTNFCGLLAVSPYEFAWYGAFVTYCHPELFEPIEPCILRPIVEPDRLFDGEAPTGQDGYFGYLFQKPACDTLQPMQTYLACLAA
ncbi:DUF6492 family protein [Sphingobium sp. YG1]|uniref:DUF6492 family protein n=1 Tax=Sphingobium sp. YG1 TaxID=2082188 RepID=UPI0011AE5E9C|nr:DUF6492 family protein [Sphingobium sp. YG1]